VRSLGSLRSQILRTSRRMTTEPRGTNSWYWTREGCTTLAVVRTPRSQMRSIARNACYKTQVWW